MSVSAAAIRQRKMDHRADVQRSHERLLSQLDGLVADLLTLHAPCYGEHDSWPTCEGCDGNGFDWEPADWLCRTYRLIAERHGRVIIGDLSTVRMIGRTD